MLQYKTKLEKSEKVQKSQNAESPLGGWGVGSKEATRNFFLLLGYNAIAETFFGHPELPGGSPFSLAAFLCIF